MTPRPGGSGNDLPLTAPELISGYASSVRIKGVKRTRSVLRSIIANAFSPMEAALALYLCLPSHLGGHAFDHPELNRMIPLPPKLARLSNRRFVMCDLFWERAALDVEYDSTGFHTGIDSSPRTNALLSMGITVISVTYAQLRSFDRAETVASMIGRRLGMTDVPTDGSVLAERRKLWASLLHARPAV